MDGLVPVILTIFIKGGKHDGQDGGGVVTDQAHDISAEERDEGRETFWEFLLIVPVVQSSFRNLKVWATHTLSELIEQGYHHLLELGRLDHVQDLFQLV